MAVLRNKPKLKRAHTQLLTPTVLRKARVLSKHNKRLFGVWSRSKNVEFLPEGIPFKLSNDAFVRRQIASFVVGLNQPLLLVSDLLSKSGRLDSARHELIEWQRYSPGRSMEVHFSALAKGNPKLGREQGMTHIWFLHNLTELGPRKAKKLTRKDYLKWRDSKEVVEKHGPRKK